jgi:hypothetical protein
VVLDRLGHGVAPREGQLDIEEAPAVRLDHRVGGRLWGEGAQALDHVIACVVGDDAVRVVRVQHLDAPDRRRGHLPVGQQQLVHDVPLTVAPEDGYRLRTDGRDCDRGEDIFGRGRSVTRVRRWGRCIRQGAGTDVGEGCEGDRERDE